MDSEYTDYNCHASIWLVMDGLELLTFDPDKRMLETIQYYYWNANQSTGIIVCRNLDDGNNTNTMRNACYSMK
jgi:hypothetical protein